jgi:hypothetical protein
MSAFRTVGATLAGFAIGLQLLLSGFLIGHVAVVANQPDLSVICSHDPAAGDSGIPSEQDPHGQCPACACPQSVSLFAAPSVPPSHAVVLPRSEPLRLTASHVLGEHFFHSPYASRAPPQSA